MKQAEAAHGRKDLNIMNTLYAQFPAFTDIFDEQTWYIFVACFVTGTVLLAAILSRFVTIKPLDR